MTKAAAEKAGGVEGRCHRRPPRRRPRGEGGHGQEGGAARPTATKALPRRRHRQGSRDEEGGRVEACRGEGSPTPRRVPKPPSPDTPALLSNYRPDRHEIPEPRGHSKDGIAYTKDFDVKFLKAQRDELIARRQSELAPGDASRRRGDEPDRRR